MGLLRLASWKRDPDWQDSAAVAIETADESDMLDPPLARAMVRAVRGDWASARDVFWRRAFSNEYVGRRRQAFYAQLACDFASLNDDVEMSLDCLQRATDHGLFDLHWLDYSPHLRALRSAPGFERLREHVSDRALAIQDALLDQETT